MYVCKKQGKEFPPKMIDSVILETDFGPKVMCVSYVSPVHKDPNGPDFVYVELMDLNINLEDLNEKARNQFAKEYNFVQEEDE